MSLVTIMIVGDLVLIALLVLLNIYFYKRTVSKLVKRLHAQERELDIAHLKTSEVDQLKADIVSLAAHQIRSPLVAISGYTSMITEGDYGKVASNVKDAVEHISEASQRLMQMANEFLDISKLQENKVVYSMDDFEMEEMVHSVYKDFKSIATKKKIEFDLNYDKDRDYTVFADVEKIRKVVYNIIDNALKYTRKGSVKVSVEKIDGKVRVVVKDTGIGISADDKDRLFHKFSRTELANQVDVTGTGLGLYIAKRIIMAQGGNVWVSSDGPGKGAMFVVELPAKHI